MTVFINLGSHIPSSSGQGWTNTHEFAQRRAAEWLHRMTVDGFTDIEVTDTGVEEEGRWLFQFRHKVTGRVAELAIHGIDNIGAYEDEHLFDPRVYWNGSSSDAPSLSDFAAEGFEQVMTYRRIGGES